MEKLAFVSWCDRVIGLVMEDNRFGILREDFGATISHEVWLDGVCYIARVMDFSCPSEPCQIISAKGETENAAADALLEQIIANRDASRADAVSPRWHLDAA